MNVHLFLLRKKGIHKLIKFELNKNIGVLFKKLNFNFSMELVVNYENDIL